MTSPQIESFLSSFVNHENNLNNVDQKAFQLERVIALLEALGSPQEKFPCVHVAGTNGKGSVCSFTESMLRAGGYRTGLYMSPHLVEVNERIAIDGHPVKNDVLLSLIEEHRMVIDSFRDKAELGRLTYFEVLTALAFCAFARAKVEIAVLETGLGGRLDATNTVHACVYGITSIGLEHTRQLGNTLEEIAGEKAAIIKSGTNALAVCSQQKKEALDVIEARCREVSVPLVVVGRDVTVEEIKKEERMQTFRVKTEKANYDLQSRIVGVHQAENAAMSIAMIEALGERNFPVSPEHINEGIASAVLPGRFEIQGTGPAVVLDIAHNPAAFNQLQKTIIKFFPDQSIKVVLGVSADKDSDAIFRIVDGFAQDVILTKAQHPRAADLSAKELKTNFSQSNVCFIPSVPEAVAAAIEQSEREDVVLITGSVYTVGEARAYLKKDQGNGKN